MGVHGLTTYLNDNRRTLATSLTFPSRTSPNSPSTPIVVDGWSFIYDLHHHSNLSWVYGGEYEEFSKLVMTVVRAWISVGLKVFFVFDGAFPRLKFTTLTNRLVQSYINPSLLFFRTSSVSRSTPRFLSESRIIPPLVYSICIYALRIVASETTALEIHLADEEGDPHAVELAGRVGGYVVGLDSDYAVLNADGYRGYIPLNEMVWTGRLQDEEPVFEDDDDFQVVKKAKGKKKPIQNYPTLERGVMLPTASADLTLSVVSYHPTTLASHFDLPVTLLPLLGAFVGNDFSNQSSSAKRNVQTMFFERQLTLSQRIIQVASTLKSILSASSQKRKQKQQIGSVMDLVERAANALLNRSVSTMGSGEMKSIVDRIVEATMQYVIPKYDGESGEAGLWPTEICALHDPEVCPVLPLFSRLVAAGALEGGEESKEVLQRDTIRRFYLTAYREGRLSPRIMNVLNTGTYWPRLFLENPDLETVSVSIGRHIRQWGYSILQDAIGLPDDEDEDRSGVCEPGQEDEDDGDELIDVVEEDSDDDQLAHLRGELKRLREPDDKGTEANSSTSSQQPPVPTPARPKSVVEYVRRGTRIAENVVLVPPLPDLLTTISAIASIPLQLRPEEERLTVLLRVVDSDTAPIRSLPREQLLVALALRWVTRAIHLRAQDSMDKGKERWTEHEAQSFLASFSWSTSKMNSPAAVFIPENPPIDDRNISLMAQALMGLDSMEYLSEILLISNRLPTPAPLFSGKICHSYWTGKSPLNLAAIPAGLWDACSDGLWDVFADGKQKKMKRRGKDKTIASPIVVQPGNTRGLGGVFGILANLDA